MAILDMKMHGAGELQARMASDGYLYFQGLLDRQKVSTEESCRTVSPRNHHAIPAYLFMSVPLHLVPNSDELNPLLRSCTHKRLI